MRTTDYEEVVNLRRKLKIPPYGTLADLGFDGPWVTPYQTMSRSPDGPVLVALHWLDASSIRANEDVLRRFGYLPGLRFNDVLELALHARRLGRGDIYMTQAFHLLPEKRWDPTPPALFPHSFNQVPRHEVAGRRVLALGNVAAGACKRHGVPHVAVCHPSRRGHSNAQNAQEIAA